ncbi:SAP3-like protein [Mya arenaria]|uniref:SAP3-like protein n=1 Tax=Mya arenaria TaxID=6604 RepID=A0ABY7DUP2_MYAAR|nr:ganglioside GM2 activator-like [Mya arenaria]XP_052794622.1 ganglioside GM2 activator-like [Mya arenaria]WAR00002.1 SAP3-like protein [Mya arenaria]WAR00046.1 SAP3-like protein [Mya arenaria]
MKLFCVIVCCIVCVKASKNVFQYEMEKADDSIDIYRHKSSSFPEQQRVPKLTSFVWKDCGGKSALVNIKSLSISPDPLSFPGTLNVAADFLVKKALVKPLKADLTLYRKVLGRYIRLPCIDDFGSCTYDDVCSLLQQVQQCPKPLTDLGLNCQCPIKAKGYSLQKTGFDIGASIIPEGDYRVLANVTLNGAEATCLDLTLSIQ